VGQGLERGAEVLAFRYDSVGGGPLSAVSWAGRVPRGTPEGAGLGPPRAEVVPLVFGTPRELDVESWS
jgi:hypothetical protein